MQWRLGGSFLAQTVRAYVGVMASALAMSSVAYNEDATAAPYSGAEIHQAVVLEGSSRLHWISEGFGNVQSVQFFETSMDLLCDSSGFREVQILE